MRLSVKSILIEYFAGPCFLPKSIGRYSLCSSSCRFWSFFCFFCFLWIFLWYFSSWCFSCWFSRYSPSWEYSSVQQKFGADVMSRKTNAANKRMNRFIPPPIRRQLAHSEWTLSLLRLLSRLQVRILNNGKHDRKQILKSLLGQITPEKPFESWMECKVRKGVRQEVGKG